MNEPMKIQIEPILVNRDVAAQMLSISLAYFENLVQSGAAPKPKKLGGGKRVAWHVGELRAYANGLPISDNLPPDGSGHGRAGKPAKVVDSLPSHSTLAAS